MGLIERTETYAQLGARYSPEPLPACSNLTFRSEPYWRCYVRQLTVAGFHPAGTCAINSVVDSQLRVIGMKNLRIVDGSIMPVIINAHLQAAVYAIAEKGAESILQDWDENKL